MTIVKLTTCETDAQLFKRSNRFVVIGPNDRDQLSQVIPMWPREDRIQIELTLDIWAIDYLD